MSATKLSQIDIAIPDLRVSPLELIYISEERLRRDHISSISLSGTKNNLSTHNFRVRYRSASKCFPQKQTDFRQYLVRMKGVSCLAWPVLFSSSISEPDSVCASKLFRSCRSDPCCLSNPFIRPQESAFQNLQLSPNQDKPSKESSGYGILQ